MIDTKPSPHAIIFAIAQVWLAKAFVIPAKASFHTFQFCNKANAWLCARSGRNMDRFNAWCERH